MYKYDYRKLHKKYIRGSLLHFTMSDEDVSDSLTTQIAQRDIYYSELLRNHMALTKVRGICKEVHKWLFFWLIVGACCVGVFYIRKIFATIFATNDVNVVVDERTGRVIMMGAMDNLVKGAAGQAVQNMNLMFGLPEDMGLQLVPMFP